jgi:outer membrane protein OmpA-like peptidoglycan-associated protein
MADLDVQPKKRGSSLWMWLLLALAALVIVFFLARGCNNDNDKNAAATTTADSSITVSTDNTAGRNRDWDIDFNAPEASYQEITDKNINVRGNDNYAIYSLGENILFDSDQKNIRPNAEKNLKQIAESISKRYKGGEVRIYGHTDAEGSKGYNKELAEQRAEAVRAWLVKNGNVSEDRITLQPVGEAQPVASNATNEGRQQNRRVEIVVRRGQ